MRLGEKPLKNRPLYILDATPLICFAKIGKLEAISEISEIVITEEVLEEATRGEHPDALAIREAIKKRVIKVYSIQDRKIVEVLLEYQRIHPGEAETLAAAKELGGYAVVDDAEARSVAKVYRIQTAPGTLFLLFRLLTSDQISRQDAEILLTQLVQGGLYLDTRTLLRAKERIKNHN
jgi:predicted nucleic acid-binding protein